MSSDMTIKPYFAGIFGAFTLLGACVGGPVVTDSAAQQTLVVKECAIYLAAEQQLDAEGRGMGGSLSAGCPDGVTPGNISATGVAGQATGFSDILFRRMIARGMPQDLAVQVATSPAFKDLVDFHAANAS